MYKQMTTLLGTLLCLFSMACIAAPPSDAQIEKYIQLSEMDSVLDGMDDQIGGQLNQMMITQGPEVVEMIRPIMEGSWDETEGKQILRSVLKQQMTSDDLNGLIAFHEQTWVRNISAAENVANSPNFESEMARFFEDMQRQPPSESRAEAIRAFVEKTQMTDVIMNMVVEISKSMQTAFADSSEQAAQQWQQTEAVLKQMAPQMEQQLTMMSYFMYRDISGKDLNAYGDFYADTLGRKETRVVIEAVNKVIDTWANRLAAEIKKLESL